jgi:23S rRNA pseudouridine2604 synthase
MRLYNYLKNRLNLNKSEVNNLFDNNKVYLNDKLAKPCNLITDNDILVVDNKIIEYELEQYHYYAYNKPVGIECANNNKSNSLVNQIYLPFRVFPVGRLDKDSNGLIILTNDQKYPSTVLAKDNHVEKEYIVTVDKKLTEDFKLKMENGVEILDTITKPCKVKIIDDYTFDIILTEGLNRQIRRMSLKLGYKVLTLKRIRFNKLVLDIKENELKEIKLEDI